MSGKRAKRERREEAERGQGVASERARSEQLKLPLDVSTAAPQDLPPSHMRAYELIANALGRSVEEVIALDRAPEVAEAARIADAMRAQEERRRQRSENARRRKEQRDAATHRRRRTKGEERSRVVTIRVNDAEYAKLNEKAAQLQISLSAYLVESGLGRRIRGPKR